MLRVIPGHLAAEGVHKMVVSHQLKWKEKRSREQSREMVMIMAMYSDNSINTQRKVPLSSEEEVLRLFQANGYDFDQVVEECRERDSTVPLVENMLGSVLYMSGVAGLLIDLHLVFRHLIPSRVISARYATDVEVVQASDGSKQ